MSAPRFTPGPWVGSGIRMETGDLTISAPDLRIVIANVHNAASLGDFVAAALRGRRDFGAPDTAVTQNANANLIAAAPAMFAALSMLCNLSDASIRSDILSVLHPHERQDFDEAISAGRAALALARGESQEARP